MAKLDCAIILAAGEGTRMKSHTPKVLHDFAGKTFLHRVMDSVRALNPASTAVVVRHQGQRVGQAAKQYNPQALVVKQDEISGTGRAVQCAVFELEKMGKFHGTVLIVASDMPLLDTQTLHQLLSDHQDRGNAATVLTTSLQNPFGYGRIIRDPQGNLLRIVEQKDANASELAVNEVNTSVYAFDAAILSQAIASLNSNNAQGEFYLTDALETARQIGHVGVFQAPDYLAVEGVNDRIQLAKLLKAHNMRICQEWMRAGVTIQDPSTTWIDDTVHLDRDVTILPGSYLKGTTSVASDAVIGPDTTLIDAQVDQGATVERSRVEKSHIGSQSTIGPWTYLRPGNSLGPRTKAGAYVEMKKATIDEGTKVPHLSYVGDAHIHENTNVGGGTITANYDGVHKNRTEIGANVHIGAGNMIVAPVEVGDNVTTGAGSVIRHQVPPDAMVYSENTQHVVNQWKPAWERSEFEHESESKPESESESSDQEQ